MVSLALSRFFQIVTFFKSILSSILLSICGLFLSHICPKNTPTDKQSFHGVTRKNNNGLKLFNTLESASANRRTLLHTTFLRHITKRLLNDWDFRPLNIRYNYVSTQFNNTLYLIQSASNVVPFSFALLKYTIT